MQRSTLGLSDLGVQESSEERGAQPAAAAAAPGARPDLTKAPKWADVVAKPEFKALPPEKQAEAKAAYFDYWIAPNAGDQAASLREQFMAAQDAQPGLLDRAMGALKGAFTAEPSVLEQRPAEAPKRSSLPVSENVRAAFNAAWDASTPEQRKLMEGAPGWKGILARERAQAYAGPLSETGRLFDTRAESRAQRLVGQGEDARFAETAARQAAARGVAPGQEIRALGGTVQPSGYDFDTKAAFDPNAERNGLNNTLARGVAKGGLGVSKAITGYTQFLADVLGADEAAKVMRQGGDWVRGKEQAIGERGTFLDRNMEGAISSISQQLPLLLGGAAAASELLPLAGMAFQSFGQEYSDGRAAGQDTKQATARAAAFAAFEVIGEKFGLKESLQAIKGAAKGLPSDQLIGFLWNALKKEVPGELLTTTGQFGVDKLPGGVGLNPNAGGAEYLQQVADTIAQTIMQSGMMAGGTTGVSRAVRYMADKPTDAPVAPRVEPVLGAQVQTGQPAADPVMSSTMPDLHPMVQEADQIVRELAQAAGIPESTVLPEPAPWTTELTPPSTTPEVELQPDGHSAGDGSDLTDQEVLDFAAGRLDQLSTKRDGEIRSVIDDAGVHDVDLPGAELSASEQRELVTLEQAGRDPNAVRRLYGFGALAHAQALGSPLTPDGGAMPTDPRRSLGGIAQNPGMPDTAALEAVRPAQDSGADEQEGLPKAKFSADAPAAGGPSSVGDTVAGASQPDDARSADIAVLEQLVDRAFRADIDLGQMQAASAVHPYQPALLPDADGLQAVAAAFGKRVVGFQVSGGAAAAKSYGGFDGVTYPQGAGNRIFINRESTRPHLAILGHEVAHQMAKDRPDLYARFVDAIRPYVKVREYGEHFAQSPVARHSYPVGAAKDRRDAAVREEFVGEVLSDGFMEPAFWQALGRKNKQLLVQVQAFVGRMIQRVASALGHTPRTDRYLTDYGRVMEIAGEIMAEFGMSQDRLNGAAGVPRFSFAGIRADTADKEALARAVGSLAAGVSPEQARRSTGWFKGADGEWRFEIDDSSARLKAAVSPEHPFGRFMAESAGPRKLGELLEHEELFRAYPGLRDLTVGAQSGRGASFNTETGHIAVGGDVPAREVVSKLLHEVQHAIQRREGFASGWNLATRLPGDVRAKVMDNVSSGGGESQGVDALVDGETGRQLAYHWSAGEVEARNVQARQFMSRGERAAIAPDTTADVPVEKQIVSKSGAGSEPVVAEEELSRAAMRDVVARAFGEPLFTTFNALHKTVGTQYHKAQVSPEFRRVFDLANRMEAVGTLVAVRAAERAPGALPKALNLVSAARQLVLGRRAAAELQAASEAILAGTTLGRTVLDGRVWSDDELAGRFGLTQSGIALYRQMRASIDAAVFEVAAAESYAMAAAYLGRSAAVQLRQSMVDDPRAGVTKLLSALEAMVKTGQRIARAQRAAGAIERAEALEADARDKLDTKRRVEEVLGFAEQLANSGYAPLMRFGRYTVTVHELDPATGRPQEDGAGNRLPPVYFERFETRAEARDAYVAQGLRYAGQPERVRITTGTVNEDEHKLYAGISPEVVSLFAQRVGDKGLEQLVTKLATSDQSALRRQLERKNVPGYSREYERVLAKFVTSSGRWVARKYFMNDLRRAVASIRQKDVQSEAQKLLEYVTNQKVDSGQDAASAVSSLAFAMFLGGPTNLASSFVNLLQVGTLLPQHLVKATSTGRALSAIASAYRSAMGLREIPAELRAALKVAEQEGKVDAQEVHHLYNVGIQGVQAAVTDQISRLPGGSGLSKQLVAARHRLHAAGVLWGAMFGAVESLNRRVTFIAAWEVAKKEGLPDPTSYAVQAVDETQGIYTKANRQNFARNPLGRMVLTFKMVPTMWVEIMVRNLRYGGKPGYYAAAMQLATMILLAGAGGLPFEDDLIDIIDTVAQAMGYNWSTKQERDRWARETFGRLWGEALTSGVSAFLPVDMAGRLGVANLVPATGLFKRSNEGQRDREVAELFGVGGSLAMMGVDAFDAANAGRMDRAVLAVAPASVRNLAQGVEMLATGEARDLATGKRKADAGRADGLYKAVGFNPRALAEAGQARMLEAQKVAFGKRVQQQILRDWAEGLAIGDQRLVEKASADQAEWNEKNPEYPIYVNAAQLRSRVRAYRQDANSRMLQGTPRRWRGTSSQELGLEDAEAE